MTSDQNENMNPTPDGDETPQTPENPTAAGQESADLDPLMAAEDEESRQEFADMLEASSAGELTSLKPGDKVSGTIIQIGDIDAFVDCGGRNELPMAVAELKDEEGQLKHAVGDEITAHVQKSPDGLKLTMAINLKEAGSKALQDAYDAGTPVEGKVTQTNKGGFSVDLGGLRAFCPFSQIDVRRADNPEIFVGKTYKFKILELSEDGRNVVVSRRALVQAERESQAEETRASIALGDVREGVVTRLVPFGAFVDLGGIEGLVHISQISHQRVGDPSDVLREGQEVKVKVLELQNLGMGRSERISLSMKALASDPWPDTANNVTPGTDVTGTVTRLVDFGVFVQLQPGVEGLIHISELANRRIIHPREILNENDEITVRILDVDLDRRRISLSRRQASDYDGE
jgi:small subunit ribosomal protein S1|nr:S1 RNA-binding domain-containing protein [Candidatus Krumholzibacteria bacterium]